MNVRRATPADAQAIAEVHVASWQGAYRGLFPDAVLDNLSVSERLALWTPRLAAADSTLWVCEDERRVVGFVYACSSRDPDAPRPKFAEIAALYIHPKAWGQGGGHALCQAVFEHVRQTSAQAVIVWVLSGNVHARHFYESQGFTADDAQRNLTRFDTTLPEMRYRQYLR